MRVLKATFAALFGILAISGCVEKSEKFYICQGEVLSYQNELDFDAIKFDDFSLVLTPKKSLSALISGKTQYRIGGDIFPEMTSLTNDYRIYSKHNNVNSTLIFHLINKEFSYSRPNAFGHTDFYYGRCIITEV